MARLRLLGSVNWTLDSSENQKCKNFPLCSQIFPRCDSLKHQMSLCVLGTSFECWDIASHRTGSESPKYFGFEDVPRCSTMGLYATQMLCNLQMLLEFGILFARVQQIVA